MMDANERRRSLKWTPWGTAVYGALLISGHLALDYPLRLSAPFFLLGVLLSPFWILYFKSRKVRWILICGGVPGIAFSAFASSTPFFHGPVLDGFSLFFGIAVVLGTFRHRVVQYLDGGQGNAT
ncbi:MAG: hypothetical protein H8E44_00715 [Planctomycetes bacterium]|nr:hypothetical protein [Planctomycetota bacterium]